MARKPSAVARELLRNLPKGGKKRRRRGSRRREEGGSSKASQEEVVALGTDDAGEEPEPEPYSSDVFDDEE